MGFFNNNENPNVKTTEAIDGELTPENAKLVNDEDDSMKKLEELISKLPTQEEITLKNIYGPAGKFDDSGLKQLEEMIKKLPTSQEITNKEVEDAANALLMKWKIEKAYGTSQPVDEKDVQAIAAKNLEALGAGIKFAEDKEDELFQDYRRKVYQKLFGISEDFAKARENALGKIATYENREDFEKAKQEAIDYIDQLIGDKAMNERINSKEFQTAVAKVKEEAIERLNKM